MPEPPQRKKSNKKMKIDTDGECEFNALFERKAEGKKKAWADPDEETIFNGMDVVLNMGKHVQRHNKLAAAMELFDTAVELDQGSLKPLQPRAATLGKLAFFEEALADVAKLEEAARGGALPHDVRRLKCETLWQGGEFERAAVLAAQGMRERMQPPYYTDMYYTSVATVLQCVGPGAAAILDELLENTEQLEKLRPIPVEDVIGVLRPTRTKRKSREEMCREQRYKEWVRQRRMANANLYLGKLSQDILFIENLSEHLALPSANKAGERRIRRHLDSISDNLTKRIGHIEEECPLYALRYRAQLDEAENHHAQAEMVRAKRLQTKEQATRVILRILTARSTGDPRLFTQALHNAKSFFEHTTFKWLPEKADYQALLYHMIGITYLQLVMPQIEERSPDARARQRRDQVNILLQTNEKKDLMMAGAAMPFFDYAGILRSNERRLRRAKSKLERLCLTFEMAHCCSKLHHWEQSRNLSRKALNMARTQGHNVWAVVAAVEQCKAELHLKNRHEARYYIKEAIELAEVLEDEYLFEMLHAISDVLDQPAKDDPEEEHESAQQAIMRLIEDDKLYNQCAEMFARINSLPAEYRMPLRSDLRPEDSGRSSAVHTHAFFRPGESDVQ